MCLTYPGEVIAIDGDEAIVMSDGRTRRATRLPVPEVRVGDRVIVGAGAILRRLDPDEADTIERLVRVAFEDEGARS